MTSLVKPAAFSDFEEIEGFDPVDKSSLVGKPFGITAVRFRTNASAVVYAEAEIVTADGEELALIDSSTGIRDQLATYLQAKGMKTGGDVDWQAIKLFVPRGLRVSEYDVKVSGETRPAKTYYLTTQARQRT